MRRSSMGHGRQRDRGWVGFWLSGKSPGDDGKIPEIRKTTRASPGLVTDRIINMREVFFEPNAENRREQRGQGRRSGEIVHIRRLLRWSILPKPSC